jgi:hypothetical protein
MVGIEDATTIVKEEEDVPAAETIRRATSAATQPIPSNIMKIGSTVSLVVLMSPMKALDALARELATLQPSLAIKRLQT